MTDAAARARVAVVGGGPAGFFLADALSRQPGIAVDLLERLPFPYGLVRYGVAPDHQGTKAVTRTFARAMARPGVRFLGGVEVGRDLSLAELRDSHHAVVLATGALAGRRAAFPGADGSHSVTAFDLARWINGHPDAPDPGLPAHAQNVGILGHGNVALDMARLFASGPARLAASDANPDFLAWLGRQSFRRLLLCGRGSAGRTRFSPEMLSELRDLPGVALLRAPGTPAMEKEETETAAAALIAALPAGAPPEALAVELHFDRRPVAFDGRELQLETSAGERLRVPADLLVHAIGQHAIGRDVIGRHVAAHDGLPRDSAGGGIANEAGAVVGQEGLFVLGWAAGTARGTIPDSRLAARRLAPAVVAAALAAAARRSAQASDLAVLLAARGVRVTDWQGWTALDRLEQERGAAVGACRRKLLRLPEDAVPEGAESSIAAGGISGDA